MRRSSVILFVAAILLGLLSPIPGSPLSAQVATEAPAPSLVKAGVGIVDMTWHVGSGAGQYATDRQGLDLSNGEIDPHFHSVKSEQSYGVQSRLTTRTLVIEGSNGKKTALVKTDNYLSQDLYTRRAAAHLAAAGSSINYDDIVLSSTHNHSSPYNMSPSLGLLLFQDAHDLRMFEYQARKIAESILLAERNLRPARMGATTVNFDIMKDNIVGPGSADDGSPAGYPRSFGDEGLVVLRFDDMTDPANPTPLATWMNFGEHPESLDGHNLISADFLSALERSIDRETHAPLIFTQGDVGSAEGPYDRGNMERLPSGEYRAYAHMGFAQMERGARHMADAVLAGWNEIGNGGGTVPWTTDFPVAVFSRWTPGPVSHPYPSLSNCRTESTVEGNPGVPVGSDCTKPGKDDASKRTFEMFKEAGIPVPDHYDHYAHLLLEENNRIRLQAVRLGDVILASCACEAQVDLILNLESRLDDVPGNFWDGYDWSTHCTQNADTTWKCPNSGASIPDAFIQRMKAQVHNDAKGWDAPENAVAANSEPLDPAKIWGNFTKEELPPSLGYKLAVGLGHTGDYVGYTVSYREYMTRNHYRKSLTSYGPHTADYMNTRLVRMAGALKGGPAVPDEPTHALGLADEVRAQFVSEVYGRLAGAFYDAWLTSLPNDAAVAGTAVTQPAPAVQRFSAANFVWNGGSNAVDNPAVRVERLVDGVWQHYADQTGEVQTFVDYPNGLNGVIATRAGQQAWQWTAHFEAFNAFPKATVPGGQVPNGTYRFVVDGASRQAGTDTPYHVESASFEVTPWTGVVARDIRRESNGDVSFAVDPVAYPRTYKANGPAARFVKDDGRTTVCKTCSFRPWASTAAVNSAAVTVTRPDGATQQVPAAFDAATGRWTAPAALYDGATAQVAPGGVRDEFGETNGAATDVVVGSEPAPAGISPVVGGSGSSGAVNQKAGDVAKGKLPFRGVGSVLAVVGALLMLLVILALLAATGTGVGRQARRG